MEIKKPVGEEWDYLNIYAWAGIKQYKKQDVACDGFGGSITKSVCESNYKDDNNNLFFYACSQKCLEENIDKIWAIIFRLVKSNGKKKLLMTARLNRDI